MIRKKKRSPFCHPLSAHITEELFIGVVSFLKLSTPHPALNERLQGRLKGKQHSLETEEPLG